MKTILRLNNAFRFAGTALLIISTFRTASAQPTPSKEEWYKIRDDFYTTLLRLDTAKEIINIQNEQLANLKQQVINRDTSVKLLQLSMKDKDSQIEVLKNNSVKYDIPPLFKFTGFYAGLSAQYNFNDSVLTKATFINGLNYSIEMNTGLIIGDKFLISGTAGIPLSRQKIYIKAFIGYRIF